MAFQLEAVCHDWQASTAERQRRTVQMLGEILPYVLAKYRPQAIEGAAKRGGSDENGGESAKG